MKKLSKITLLGGDLRQAYAADLLSGYFEQVATWGMGKNTREDASVIQYETLEGALAGCEFCVLPIKATRDGVTLDCPLDPSAKTGLLSILDNISSNSTILHGIVSNDTLSKANWQGIRCVNYYEREDLQIKNALLTAEGAIAEGITKTSFALSGARVAVLGYGRIAKLLSEKLRLLGSDVTVFARKPADRALAYASGVKSASFDFSDRLADDFDIIYNTVPARIIDSSIVSHMKKDVVFIDLATAPGGIDFDLATSYDITAVPAWGLPGKIAPKTAGEIVAQTIVQILTEEGYFT